MKTKCRSDHSASAFMFWAVKGLSHNFSGMLMREYDEILVMDDGKLLAHGHYDELLESCPYFKRICEIKFGKL